MVSQCNTKQVILDDNLWCIPTQRLVCQKISSPATCLLDDTNQCNHTALFHTQSAHKKRNDGAVVTYANRWKCETENMFVALWQQHPHLSDVSLKGYQNRAQGD